MDERILLVTVRVTLDVPMSGTLDTIIEKVAQKWEHLKPAEEMEVKIGDELIGTFSDDGWTQYKEMDE